MSRFINLHGPFDHQKSRELGITVEKLVQVRREVVATIRREMEKEGYDLDNLTDDEVYEIVLRVSSTGPLPRGIA